MKAQVFSCLFLILLSACGSPLVNEAKPEPLQNQNESASVSGDQNLLASRGCPVRFKKIPLCAEIEWFDDLGRRATGPIYWENYFEHAMSARLSFWSTADGWPIDPRQEFSEVKDVQVKLYMPTHGHGSDLPLVKEVKGRVGQFEISEIRFIMGGGSVSKDDPWQVRIQLKTQIDSEVDPHEAQDNHLWHQEILEFYRTEDR